LRRACGLCAVDADEFEEFLHSIDKLAKLPVRTLSG